MTEKGGHFGRALALALAAHALLFLLFAQLVRNAVVVAGARVQPVEIELAGPGSPGPPGAGAPVSTRAPGSHRRSARRLPLSPPSAPQAHPPRPAAPAAPSPPQAQAETQLPVQRPAEASTAAPAPALSTQPATSLPAPPLSASGSGLAGHRERLGRQPGGIRHQRRRGQRRRRRRRRKRFIRRFISRCNLRHRPNAASAAHGTLPCRCKETWPARSCKNTR